MRVNQGKFVVAFDNTHDRALRGTRGWQDYEIVLQLPLEATDVSFGVLLSGSGAVWQREKGPEDEVRSHLDIDLEEKTLQPLNNPFGPKV